MAMNHKIASVERSSGSDIRAQSTRQWYAHCESVNPYEGCALVDHASGSYNPVQVPHHIVWGPGTWDQGAAWMRAHGFSGW
jgi:hypothetical protein